jgi:hypothetical protein
MFNKSRKSHGELVRRAFEILLNHPEGMTFTSVLQRFQQDIPEDYRGESYIQKLYYGLLYGAVAPTKALWLVDDQGHWSVTEKGRKAFYEFQDPEQFLAEAARHSFKGWVTVQFPRLYAAACRTRYQATIEYRLARRVGPRRLARELMGITAPWHEVLPVQKSFQIEIPGLELNTMDELLDYLASAGVKYMTGGHTAYLPPESWARTKFNVAQSRYPANAGLKIIKNPGGIGDTNYVHTSHPLLSKLHKKITHSHKHLSLVANLLYSHDLGPRFYDLVELQCGQQTWTAYVIEHVDGRKPTRAECEAGLDRIKELEARQILRVTIPDGYNDEDFLPPDCNGNAMITPDGEFRYIDFQNFLLVNYEVHLKERALQATSNSHFGDRSLLRGGNYLYQTVPGVALPAKRDAEKRMGAIRKLLDDAGLTIQNHLVLDVGCNIGMMMAQYLKAGAAWCHGWDLEYITKHAESLLLSIGAARFSTTGGNIMETERPEKDLPEFLRSQLDDCVISYLSVQNWIGWVPMLGRIPWSFLIYEGHEDETQADFERNLAELGQLVKFTLAGVGQYQDGDSEPRTVAVLIRQG